MYLETLMTSLRHPEDAQKKLNHHFFKPYTKPSQLLFSALTPIDAIFEDSLPNIFHSILFVSSALFHTIAAVGHLMIGQGKNSLRHFERASTHVFLATAAAALIVLAPILEVFRFFSRWWLTLLRNTTESTPLAEKATETAATLTM